MSELQLADLDLFLRLAVMISPTSIKDIADATGIKASTLYKWKTTSVHLSAKKADTLLEYFAENELFTSIVAEVVKTVLTIFLLNSSSFSE